MVAHQLRSPALTPIGTPTMSPGTPPTPSHPHTRPDEGSLPPKGAGQEAEDTPPRGRAAEPELGAPPLRHRSREAPESHVAARGDSEPEELLRRSSSEPCRPAVLIPELSLNDDEDDYWGGFQGTAPWQRGHAEKEEAAATSIYSWPQQVAEAEEETASRKGAPGSSKKKDNRAPLSPRALNLTIPLPSAQGASLNAEGEDMATRLGRALRKRCEEWTSDGAALPRAPPADCRQRPPPCALRTLCGRLDSSRRDEHAQAAAAAAARCTRSAAGRR